MPLIKGKSKKAFDHNVKAEMHAGKPQNESLAIAYSVKSKAKKKASGGSVKSGSKDMNYADGGEISASNEKRPTPSEKDNDSKMVSRNSGNKSPKDDQWTDNPTIKQAQKPSITKLSRPKMVGSDAFSVRDRDDVSKDLDRMDSEAPDGYKNQPRSRYNEEGPDRQGPKVSDMQSQHNNGKAPYKSAIEDQYSQDEAESDMKNSYAEGGEVNETEVIPDKGFGKIIRVGLAAGGMAVKEDSEESQEREEEAHLQSGASPSEDEGASDARSRNEEGPDRQGPKVPDMERQHNNGRMAYAEGGMAHEMDDVPTEEADEERHSSIAAAIMAKKARILDHMNSGSADMDRMVRMYEGGQVEGSDESQADLDLNSMEQPNAYYKRNEDEVLKENYASDMEDMSQPMDSNEMGDEREDERSDKHDMVSKIRSSMKARRQSKSK